jgi:hypothetical protein
MEEEPDFEELDEKDLLKPMYNLNSSGNSGYGCSHVVRSLVYSACHFIIFYRVQVLLFYL